jgi:hypothetical protein
MKVAAFRTGLTIVVIVVIGLDIHLLGVSSHGGHCVWLVEKRRSGAGPRGRYNENQRLKVPIEFAMRNTNL